MSQPTHHKVIRTATGRTEVFLDRAPAPALPLIIVESWDEFEPPDEDERPFAVTSFRLEAARQLVAAITELLDEAERK